MKYARRKIFILILDFMHVTYIHLKWKSTFKSIGDTR